MRMDWSFLREEMRLRREAELLALRIGLIQAEIKLLKFLAASPK